MEIVWIIIGSLLVVTGILGAFIPVIPGTPFNYAALLLMQFTLGAPFSWSFLLLWGIVVGIPLREPAEWEEAVTASGAV